MRKQQQNQAYGDRMRKCGKQKFGQAFFVGSMFLSVLPLAVIGAAIWWVRRRARALQADSLAPSRATQ